MAAQSLYLSSNIFFSEVSGLHILLDTTKDKYFLFDKKKTRWFKEIVDGPKSDQLSDGADDFKNHLVQEGILTYNADLGKAIETRTRPAPVASIADAYYDLKGIADHKYFLSFTLAFVHSSRLKKNRSFQTIIQTASHWRDTTKTLPSKPAKSADSVYALARYFDLMTPYFFVAKDACFFKSLMLMDFLRRHDVAADWEFGVTISKFSAHCWVEYEGVVLNDALGYVNGFTKIMSV